MSLQVVQRCFQKAGFSSTNSTADETDESNIQKLQSLSIWLHVKILRQKITLTLIRRIKQKLMSSLRITGKEEDGTFQEQLACKLTTHEDA
jgi:hypothetical protein